MDSLRRLLGLLNLNGQITPRPETVQAALGFSDMPTTESLPRGTAAQAILAEIIEQAIAAGQRYRIKLSGSERYAQLKKEPAELQLAVIEAAIRNTPPRNSRSYVGNSWQVQEARKTIISQLLRRKIEVPVELQAAMLDLWLRSGYSLEYSDVPGVAILNAVERHAAEHELPGKLRPILQRIDAKLTNLAPHRRNPTKWEQGVIDRIAALLDPKSVENRPRLPNGQFADAFIAWMQAMPADGQASWQALAEHAASAADKSAPARKWQDEARALVSEIGFVTFAEGLRRWLAAITPDPSRPDHSLDILKGMLWMAPLAEGEDLAGPVGRFAETCFRKIRGVGARSVKLGNAALFALSDMAEQPMAGAELFRLRGVVKYPSARKILDKRLEELAEKSGQDLAAMEDKALPDYGLVGDGTLTEEFGAARGVLTLSATGTEIAWSNAAGKPVKSVPAAVKQEFKEDLAGFKQAAKDIEKARASQAQRLEQSWIEGRDWRLGDWREHFLAHPLRRALVEALIWQVGGQDSGSAILPVAGKLCDITGAEQAFPDDARISLWHPLFADPDAVIAWRARIMDLQLVQPIKQAHREVYVLTEAERQTGVYSNRFAAHILRQHQFRALCQARGWKFEFLGGWDNWNVPTRLAPERNLIVEYSVEPVEDGQVSDSYVPLFLASDQVRFVDGTSRQALNLEAVDPIVFSELLRDVDLFVAVTSVANDPEWRDGGPDGRFGTYWREWAFGELGQSAETRKELIAQIAPKLSIASKLEIGEKALIVTGKRQRYAIHFGSTNIQILPANRYLCIVPARDPAETAKIHLPFAGDNQLSTILAKAFMLVDEDKIKDPTILAQL